MAKRQEVERQTETERRQSLAARTRAEEAGGERVSCLRARGDDDGRREAGLLRALRAEVVRLSAARARRAGTYFFTIARSAARRRRRPAERSVESPEPRAYFSDRNHRIIRSDENPSAGIAGEASCRAFRRLRASTRGGELRSPRPARSSGRLHSRDKSCRRLPQAMR